MGGRGGELGRENDGEGGRARVGDGTGLNTGHTLARAFGVARPVGSFRALLSASAGLLSDGTVAPSVASRLPEMLVPRARPRRFCC